MITIKGEPKGKQRPRFTSCNNGHTYTPKETKEYEQLIKDTWLWEERDTYHGAVNLMITAYFKVPKSASKSAAQAMVSGYRRPVKTPDADNIIKIVMDGLNGAAYDDDKQVVTVSLSKYYAMEPRVEIEVVEV